MSLVISVFRNLVRLSTRARDKNLQNPPANLVGFPGGFWGPKPTSKTQNTGSNLRSAWIYHVRAYVVRNFQGCVLLIPQCVRKCGWAQASNKEQSPTEIMKGNLVSPHSQCLSNNWLYSISHTHALYNTNFWWMSVGWFALSLLVQGMVCKPMLQCILKHAWVE